MSNAKFYIKFGSYWQGSADYFAGPFDSKAEAEREIERANSGSCSFVRSDLGQSSGDVKNDMRIYGIFNTTEARKRGMKDEWKYEPQEVNVVPRLMATIDVLNYLS